MQPKKVLAVARRVEGEIRSCREQAGIIKKRGMNGSARGVNWRTSRLALVSRSIAHSVIPQVADSTLQRSMGILSMIH